LVSKLVLVHSYHLSVTEKPEIGTFGRVVIRAGTDILLNIKTVT